MANKKINELVEKAVINANDLVFVGDPTTGWLYNTTIADLQVGSITGGLAGSGQAGYIPRFKTAQTLENSLLFNGTSGIGIGTSASPYYLGLNGDYARTIGLTRSLLGATSGGLGLTILAGGATSGMLNSSGGDLILKSGIPTGSGMSAIRLFTGTSGALGSQDNALIERVSILGNGNTGFGVINPTYKVEVGGNIGNGQYGIDTSFVTFNNAPTSVPTTPGTLRWNDTDGTLEFTMKGGNVTQQIGQELPILVKHADNTGLINGKVVYSTGSDGGNLTVRYANNGMESTSSTTFGVMTEDATGGSKGFCTTFGLVRDLDTSAMTEGAAIWLDSIDGGMTTTKPIQPKHLVYIGVCLRSHATNGVIFVNVSNGQELDELHDVLITNKQNNQALIYDSANSLWKNRTIIGANGYIPYWDSTDLYKQSPLFTTSGGSIGLGTTNPFKTFSVVGQIGVYSSATNYGFLDTANNSFGLTSANGFYFTANNIGTVATTRVEANGNWGFGVGTPSYKVDVNGDVNTNGLYRVNGSQISTSNVLEGSNLYFTSNRVLNQVLTGLNVTLSGYVQETDSLIVGISKLQNQVNGKQPLLINPITGTGTTNQIAYFNGTTSLTSSSIFTIDTSTNKIGINGGLNITLNGSNDSIISLQNSATNVSYLFFNGNGFANSVGMQSSNGQFFINNTGGSLYYTQLGKLIVPNSVSASSFIKSGGTSSQYLMADGSVSTLTNPITGSLTTNYIPKATGTTTLGNSLIYDTGTSIAIGATSTYGWRLFIRGSSAQSLLLENTGASSVAIGFSGSTTTTASRIGGDGNDLYIQTNSTEQLRITSTGNVGIGTSSPTTITNYIAQTINGTNGSFTEYQQGGANTFRVGSDSSLGGFLFTQSTLGIRFGTNGSEKMRLDSSGNLGLGVTPSAWSLGKAFQIGITTSFFNDGSGNTYLGNNFYYNAGFLYSQNGNAVNYVQTSTGEHRWLNAPNNTTGAGTAISFTQAMTLDASGNLGIGVTSAGNRLVLGNTKYIAWKYSDNTESGGISVLSDNSMSFYQGNGEKLRITTGGNVGIGTSSPSYRTHIETTSADVFLTKNTSTTSFNRSFFYKIGRAHV